MNDQPDRTELMNAIFMQRLNSHVADLHDAIDKLAQASDEWALLKRDPDFGATDDERAATRAAIIDAIDEAHSDGTASAVWTAVRPLFIDAAPDSVITDEALTGLLNQRDDDTP